MSAVAGRDDHSGPVGIARDPEVTVPGIAVEANAGVDDGRILQRRKGSGEKLAQVSSLFRGDGSLGRFGMHPPAGTVPGDLDDSGLRMRGKTVIAGLLD